MTNPAKTTQYDEHEGAAGPTMLPRDVFAETQRDLAAAQLEACRKMIVDVDTSDRDSWKDIVSALLTSGFTQAELEEELAASPNTIYKWRTGSAAPREMTRRLLRKAVLEMIDERLTEQHSGR